MKHYHPLFLAWLTLTLGGLVSQADQQTVELQENWNLFSLYVTPTDPAVESVLSSLIASGRLRSVFTYKHEGTPPSGVWKRYSPGLPTEQRWLNTLSVVRPYQGYWVNVDTSGAPGGRVTLTITGRFSASPQRVVLQPGWNLIGLGNDQPIFWADGVGWFAGSLESLFVFSRPVGFQGFQRPRFSNVGGNIHHWVYEQEAGEVRSIQPGQALWVKVPAETRFGPELEVEVESDVDAFSPGATSNSWFEEGVDTDMNANGILDYGYTRRDPDPQSGGIFVKDRYGNPYINTQDTIWFRIPTGAAHANLAILRQQITILNYGSGVLHYQIEADAPWLLAAPPSGRVVQGVAGQTVTLSADIAGMLPGEKTAVLRVRSNGGQKQYHVRLTVPGLGGLYAGDILVADISGRATSPRQWPLQLSYNPEGSSVIRHSGSPMFTRDATLHNLGTATEFVLVGTDVISAEDPLNPYGIRYQRDVRLQGRRMRIEPGVAPGENLGLEGTYEETLSGLPGAPIETTGVFLLSPITDTSRLEEP